MRIILEIITSSIDFYNSVDTTGETVSGLTFSSSMSFYHGRSQPAIDPNVKTWKDSNT